MYSLQAVTTSLAWFDAGTSWNSTYPSLPGAFPTILAVNTTRPNTTPQIVNIIVGAQGRLAFNPGSVTVLPGTILRFDFLSQNHTLTQSSFNHPCSNVSGIDTGFNQFNSLNSTGKFTIDYYVNSSQPQWFFCAQNLPRSHCAAGMVFSLNPGGLIESFENNAKTPVSLNNSTISTAASYCHGITRAYTSGSFAETSTAPSRSSPSSLTTSRVVEISNNGYIKSFPVLLLTLIATIVIFTI
jgi:plastocyanin